MKTLDDVMSTLSGHTRRMIELRAIKLKQLAKRLKRIRRNKVTLCHK